MRHGREESSAISTTTTTDQTLDIISAVLELNGLSSQELNRLLKDSENHTIKYKTEEGSLRQVDLEKVASFLPLHLIAMLLSPDRTVNMAHVLRGLRLLHTLSDLATRHGRFEQILLDDVKVSEQILDLIFFTLIVLARCNQENHHGASSLLHSVIVACSLHLLTTFVSSQWHDLVHVLLEHSKVDIFMDVAFDAVREDIRNLDNKLKTLHCDILLNKASLSIAEKTAHFLCQQCEASLHFLLSLCQQKLFCDRILRNKELCKEGGILILAYAILKLEIPHSFKESSDILASVSRLKAKVLSILLQLCEAESIFFLDEVAGSSESMHLAKSVALEFLALLKTAYKREIKQPGGSHYRSNPMGLVVLNALHLADIFSDDSNFRSFFMTTTVPFLAEIFSVPQEEFTSNWCSLRVPTMEEDANIEYDPFIAAGVVLDSLNSVCESAQSPPFLLSEVNYACPLNVTGVTSGTYAQQRTSCLVKIIANLHVFVPIICEEEDRDLFLNIFYEYLLMETSSLLPHPTPHIQKASIVCKNFSSLSQYAASLAPSFLNDEDVHLLSAYADKLEMLTQRLYGEGTSQENCIKVKTEDTKSDTMNHAQDSPPYWAKVPNSTFARSHQDSQDIIQSSAMQKQDESIEKVAPQFHYKDADLNGLSRQGSRSQETDETANLNDRFEYNLSRKGNITNTSASLRDSEKETGSIKTNDIVQPCPRMDLELLPDGRESHTRESGIQEDDKADNEQVEEKRPRKRKRNIMSEKQIELIERALLYEPEMQKNGPLLQSWADKLSSQGSEITSSQLKNWLNNRKARLARAAKEVTYAEKSSGPSLSSFYDSPESVCDENCITPGRGSGQQYISRTTGMITRAMSSDDSERSTPSSVHGTQLNHPKFISLEPDQFVSIADSEGKVVGEGKIYQVDGRWHDKILDGRTCVVDVTDLKFEKWKEVQYPSEATGRTFEEAAARNEGVMRVLWDKIRISPKSSDTNSSKTAD